MIAPKELDRITASQLASWEANKGVIWVKEKSPSRSSRLDWLAKMRSKLKKNLRK